MSIDGEGGPDGGQWRPRWVTVFAVIALLLVVLFLVLLAGGAHGPGRHLSSAPSVTVTSAEGAEGAGEPAPPAGVLE